MNYLSIRLFRLLLVVVLLTACESGEKNNSESSSNDFTAPQDGKLSEKQLLNYVAIRQRVNNQLKKREQQKLKNLISDSETPDRNTLYFDEIEKSVAQDMRVSYAEYLWIKDTVIATRTSMWLKRYYEANNKIATLLNQTLDHYSETGVSNLNKLEQQKMDGYVKEMRNELAKLQQKLELTEEGMEVLKHNSSIIEKYQSDLVALDKTRN